MYSNEAACTGGFDWTDAGIMLLIKIKAEIKAKGGSIDCAAAIEREWGIITTRDAANKRVWTPSDEYYLVSNFPRMTIGDLGRSLNRTGDAIMSKYIKLQGGLKSKFIKAVTTDF